MTDDRDDRASSASTSARPRSRPAWSVSTAGCSPSPGPGYGLDVGHGPGWAEQDPAAWWSAVVVAVRALRPPEPVDVVAIGVDGHGPTLAAVDDARRGHATGDHLPRYARRRPRPTSSPRRPASAAGRSVRCRPPCGWSATSRTPPRATRWYLTTWEWLAFRLTGAAAAPLVPGQAVPDPTVVAAATGLHVDRRPPAVAMGAVVGDADAAPPPRRSVSGPASRSPAARTTPSRAISARASPQAGDAYDPGGSAGGFGVYWHEPVEVPGAFVTPAPLAGLYSVGRRHGGHRPGARLVPRQRRRRRRSRPSDCSRRRPPRRPAPTASSSCRTWPASARRSGTRPRPASFVGLTLAHGRGHLARAILEASALAIRHVADTDARRRRHGRLRCVPAAARPAARPGTRSRPTSRASRSSCRRVLETAVLGSAILGAVGDRGLPGRADRRSAR